MMTESTITEDDQEALLQPLQQDQEESQQQVPAESSAQQQQQSSSSQMQPKRSKKSTKTKNKKTSSKSKSQRKKPSQARLRMESMANTVDHKIAAAFTLVLLLYATITLGTWVRLDSSGYSDHAPVLRDAVTDRTVITRKTKEGVVGEGMRRSRNEKKTATTTKDNNNPAVIVERSTIKADEIPDIETLQHTFPVHAGHDLEEIDHPGVLMSFFDIRMDTERKKAMAKARHEHPEIKAKMKVPKFWRPIAYGPDGVREFLGQHGQRLITPEEAKQIGSFTPDGLETIYVSIASYRDPECQMTLEDMFTRADHPERMRVAVIDQLAYNDPVPPCNQPLKPCDEDPSQGLCKYSHLIDRLHLPALMSVGPVFARHLAHRMYRGEYFAMQLDSHVRFIEHWDTSVVSQWKSAKNEMGILTVYLSDLNGSIDPVTHENKHPTRPIMCKTDYESQGKLKHLRHGQQPEGYPGIHGEPTLHPFWAAGFSFARGHFVVQVPYDQFLPMVFQGEEISIGLRAFTHGYDFYTPETSIAFHMYAIKANKDKRKKINLFWENANFYLGAGIAGMKRLNGIIGMGEPDDEYYHEQEEEYSLGHVRTKEKFFKMYGIHPETQTVEDNLCRFVGKPMQKMFKPTLRENGMGLDLDKINFEWKDPDKGKAKPK